MTFGLILLLAIAAISVFGSIIPQGNAAMYYVEHYSSSYGLILKLGLDDVFHSWYFAVLTVLLCMNLVLCSIIRISTVVKAAKGELERAINIPAVHKLTEKEVLLVERELRFKRCSELEKDSQRIYSKNGIGRYGTFVTHVGILMTVIFFALVLSVPKVSDRSCMPGEYITMPDGTGIYVRSFRIEDETGRLDYTSEIEISLPDGRLSGVQSVSVNHPVHFGEYKVYQQTYGTAGSISVLNTDNNGTDDFLLTDTCFLSADGVNGLWYDALYPGYVVDDDNSLTLITNTSGHYEDPIYIVQLAEGGVFSQMILFPGDTVTVGNLHFTANEPVEYPGLRIKYTPNYINVMLIASFAVMTFGLWMTFFMQPVLVKVNDEGYTVCGTKPEAMEMDLALLLDSYKERKEKE